MLVPLERSVAWLTKMQQRLEKIDASVVPFTHVLGSGLHSYEPLREHVIAYKDYLDALGFADFVKKYELIFVDTAETGQSLQKIEELFTTIYPEVKGHTQNIGLLYSRNTIDILKMRIVYLMPTLTKLLFAKHAERSGYSPYDVFYPHDWAKGDPMKTFTVPEAAINIEQQLTAWIDARKHHQVVKSLPKS